jgi:hypothetical protein
MKSVAPERRPSPLGGYFPEGKAASEPGPAGNQRAGACLKTAGNPKAKLTVSHEVITMSYTEAMQQVNKENLHRSQNLPPVKAPGKRGSFGRLMSALTEDEDEKLAKDVETKLIAEDKRTLDEERTRNETLSLMSAMVLDRQMKDEDYALSLAQEEKRNSENMKIVQDIAEAKSAEYARGLQSKLEQEDKQMAAKGEQEDEELALRLHAAEKQSEQQHKQDLADRWADVTPIHQLQADSVLILITLPHLTDVSVSLASSNVVKVCATASAAKFQYAKKSKPVKISEKLEILTKEMKKQKYQPIKSQDVSFEYESSTFELVVKVALRAR